MYSLSNKTEINCYLTVKLGLVGVCQTSSGCFQVINRISSILSYNVNNNSVKEHEFWVIKNGDS